MAYLYLVSDRVCCILFMTLWPTWSLIKGQEKNATLGNGIKNIHKVYLSKHMLNLTMIE